MKNFDDEFIKEDALNSVCLPVEANEEEWFDMSYTIEK